MRLISILLFATLVFAQDISLNFQNLDIKDFIKMVAKITHKNILITKHLRGKVNFIAVKPVKKKELYSILLDILRTRDYTLVENDKGYLELVTSKEAIESSSFKASDFPQISTTLVNLKHIQPKYAQKQIKPFLSKFGKIIIPNNKSFIMVSDFPQNIKKIKYILSRLDAKNEKLVEFIKIQNVLANNILKKLNNILSNLILKDKYKIYADDSSNSIILIGSKNIIKKIKPFIIKLDVKPKEITKTTQIIHLKNSDAKDIYKIINKLIKSQYKKNPPIFTLDESGNSLILIGEKTKVNVIENIISALDTPKQQVFIKVKILEISNMKTKNVGMQLGIVGGSASGSGLYTFSANLGGPAVAINTSSLGLATPTIKQGLALGATIDLLETLGAAKKLSEPSLLCVNNIPSTIYVGKTESVIVQSTVGTSTTDVTKNTYSRQDIGLKLTLKPRIDIDNKVSINIKGIIEDILPGSQIGLPTTSKREIYSTTIVSNGQSVIIGGLIKNNSDITVSKVPVLGDIPILGALFRHKSKNDDQTTLVIIVTPYIVKTSSDLDKLRNVFVKLNEVEKSFVNKILKKKDLKNVKEN